MLEQLLKIHHSLKWLSQHERQSIETQSLKDIIPHVVCDIYNLLFIVRENLSVSVKTVCLEVNYLCII